jgi:hypothetical protein
MVAGLYSSNNRNIMECIAGGAEMDYMTLKEASEKWGVSIRQINYYCAGGRIPGAVKVATIWLIPKDAEKPVDMRTKQGKEQKNAKDTLC